MSLNRSEQMYPILIIIKQTFCTSSFIRIFKSDRGDQGTSKSQYFEFNLDL